jgi:peptidoglycan/LPS O-acetylase OafA/YrhL
MTEARDHQIDFRPDIEGLRAVAVLSVVTYHLDARWLPGGFIGVDIFFVISGYLITALLLRRMREDRYSIVGFYAARVRRIFPALFVVLAATVIAAAFLLPPKDAADYGRTVRSTALFYSNLELNQQTDYFAGAAELKPLLHTWSLAVEEQYYVVFPLLLSLLSWRFRQGIGTVIIAVGLLSILLSWHWATKYPALGFYSALSRAHELLIGAWVAAAAPSVKHPRGKFCLTLAGCALILVPLLTYTNATRFPGYLASLPCLGAAFLIVSATDGSTFASRALSLRPVRFFGAISYSLYLWHWPVLAFSRHWLQREPTSGVKALALATMIAMATLSWRYIERPSRAIQLSASKVLAFGFAAIVVAVLVGIGIETQDGVGVRFSAESKQYFESASDSNPRRRACHASDFMPLTYAEKCVFGSKEQLEHPSIAVWADSHGSELAYSLGEAVAAHGQAVAQITYSSCPPAVGFRPPAIQGCVEHNERTLQELTADPNIQTVVMAAYYSFYARQDFALFLSGIETSIRRLRAAGKQIILFGPVPTYAYPVPQALGMRVFWNLDPTDFGQTRSQHYASQSNIVKSLCAIQGRVDLRYFDPAESLCASGRCVTSEGGRALYLDSNHLNIFGTTSMSRELMAQQLLAFRQPAEKAAPLHSSTRASLICQQ